MKAGRERSKWHCSLSGPSPTYSITTQPPGLPALVNTQAFTPYYTTGMLTKKKKLAQMKEQIKTTEKIQLSNDEEIANISDAQFKTLVIRMLTELVEYGCKLEEKMKDMLSEIKENVQGTNSDGKETGTQINGVDQKEERNTQQKRMKKQEFKKMSRGLVTSRTSLNVPTSKL